MMEGFVSKNLFYKPLVVGMILWALVAQGCGANSDMQPAHRAEKVVEQFLDAWSRGEPPDQFADPNSPISGTDSNWKEGDRLLSFLTVECKQVPDTPDHIRCRVALSLQDRKGRKSDREVVYDVQLGEKSVISQVSP
jgi:hypothetical protein